MHSVYCLRYLSWTLNRLSTTLSGFTAKLAGTERGITEPTPTFSACFGAAFLSLHPTKYAEELVKKMERLVLKHIWLTLVGTELVNVSLSKILVVSSMLFWMALLIRLLLRLFLSSISLFLQNCRCWSEDPWSSWHLRMTLLSGMKKSKDLAGRFIKNFAKFTGNEAGKKLVAAGPKFVLCSCTSQRFSTEAKLLRIVFPWVR